MKLTYKRRVQMQLDKSMNAAAAIAKEEVARKRQEEQRKNRYADTSVEGLALALRKYRAKGEKR